MPDIAAFFGVRQTTPQAKRRSSLDIIVYLASLASDPRAIEPVLDKVRAITSFLKPGELPSEQDAAKLAPVYYDLENYLTQREPLRAFTKDDLRNKIVTKFQIGAPSIEDYWQQASQAGAATLETRPLSSEVTTRIQHIRSVGRKLAWTALILGLVGLVMPSAPTPQHPFSNNTNMFINLTSNVLLFSASWLFLKGLAGFKDQLKTVYRLLCTAMILLALAQVQQVIYTYFGSWSAGFIQQGGGALGFVPAAVLIYIAMYKFARLLNVRGFTSSALAMLLVGAILAILAIVLPIPSTRPPAVLHVALVPMLFLGTMTIFAVLIALAIKRVAAPAYTGAMAWLILGLAAPVPISLISIINLIFLAPGNALMAYGGSSVFFVVTGFCLLRSAVAFNLITED